MNVLPLTMYFELVKIVVLVLFCCFNPLFNILYFWGCEIVIFLLNPTHPTKVLPFTIRVGHCASVVWEHI